MGKKVKITRDMIEEVGIDEVLSLIDVYEALDHYDDSIIHALDDDVILNEAEFRNLLNDDEEDPKELSVSYLISEAASKINGKGTFTNQESKDLICDYIDNHLIDHIHIVQ